MWAPARVLGNTGVSAWCQRCPYFNSSVREMRRDCVSTLYIIVWGELIRTEDSSLPLREEIFVQFLPRIQQLRYSPQLADEKRGFVHPIPGSPDIL